MNAPAMAAKHNRSRRTGRWFAASTFTYLLQEFPLAGPRTLIFQHVAAKVATISNSWEETSKGAPYGQNQLDSRGLLAAKIAFPRPRCRVRARRTRSSHAAARLGGSLMLF